MVPKEGKSKPNNWNTHQNFNNDMHANFNVMTNPIPVITFYRNPPEIHWDTKIYQETFALHIRGNILKQKPGGIHHIYQISYHSETSQSLLNFNIIISLTITADTITTHKYAQPSTVISRNFLTIFYGFHNDSPKTTLVKRLLPS
jgi:hypothetical protein